MQKFFGKAALLAATGLAVAALAPSAASAATVFTFDNGGTNSSNSAGDVRTFTVGGLQVEVTGWSTTGSSSGSTVAAGYVGQYSGYGLGVTDTAETGSAPNHTVDNSGRTDFLILQFSQAVDVSSLGLTAWGDTDLSWAVGNTNVPFSGSLSFSTWGGVSSLFGALQSSTGSALADGTGFTRPVNGSNTFGNLFIVAAALPNPDGSADYIKLKSVTAAVPEPATWAMMLAGFGALGLAMRRRRTDVSFA